MDIKNQVIQEYLSGGTSYRKLSAKYGMSRDVINKWVMIHQGVHNLQPSEQQQKYYISAMNSSKKKFTTEQQQAMEVMQEKIAFLEKQLQWEKLRADALDTMINVAEQQLNIPIRKKPGTQQSEK
jgi:transposase-like protein